MPITKKLIEKEGGECTVKKADVSQADDVKDMVRCCLEIYDRIDILHNNVGIDHETKARKQRKKQWAPCTRSPTQAAMKTSAQH